MSDLYVPEPIPNDPELIPEFLVRELARIQTAFSQINDHETLHAAPSRVYEGLVVVADGSDWNPGSGGGPYIYFNSRWIRMSGDPFYLDVAKGNVPGHAIVHKFGHSLVGTTLVAITETGAYQTPTTAQSLEFVSTSASDGSGGVGATKITYVGLDSNWDEVTNEITTNGTTPVALPDSLFRLHRWYVSETGTYGSLVANAYVGDLTIRVSGAGATWSQIPAASVYPAQSTIGVYSVPRNKRAYVLSKNVFVDANKSVNLYMLARDNADDVTTPFLGARKLIQEEIGLTGVATSAPIVPRGPHTGPCDIGYIGNVSVGTADVAVEFELLIVDDGY